MISTAFQGVFVLGSCLGSTYLSNARTYFMAGNVAISLVGVVMIRELDATLPWSRFFGFCLSLAYTAIMGLKSDLSLSGSEYSWASGIYYFGYLAASYPAGMLIVRFPVAKLIAASV